MQTSSIVLTSDSEYIPRDDQSEAARLVDINGTGEPKFITAEEVKEYSINDFGYLDSSIP